MCYLIVKLSEQEEWKTNVLLPSLLCGAAVAGRDGQIRICPLDDGVCVGGGFCVVVAAERAVNSPALRFVPGSAGRRTFSSPPPSEKRSSSPESDLFSAGRTGRARVGLGSDKAASGCL